MPNLSGITIASQALQAHSNAMQVVEHNVANANTPGYRRQSAILTATLPSSIGGSEFVKGTPGQIGSGVTIDRIQRFNLQFFDARFRSVSAETKNWESQSSILAQFEPTMAETTTDGLLPKLDEFWASWQSLSADPTNTSLRTILLDNASSLANGFTRRSEQITQLRGDQNLAVSDQVGQINSLSTQVATLNGEISRVLSVGEQPNDLLDKRDQVLDKLSELTGAVSFEQKNGEVTVSIGGHVLVVGHETFKLKTQNNAGMLDVYWQDNQQLIPPSGELKGILEVRDTFLKNQQDGLNTLATKLIEKVNTVHSAGFGLNNATGINFFVAGSNAANIAVNPLLDAASIGVASGMNQPGNNTQALAIAGLKSDKTVMTVGTGTVSMNEFYNMQITDRAIYTQRAADNATQNNLVAKALGTQRESVSGVSLDEEAANMAKTQKAYQASARMLTAYDEMLDIVINRMGLVGR
ncbi:MAG: flagellar hook-associated protein FlgK [Chloroflexi bacterium]|nr:flagellar hook-associated protein FlgK [Chloroflexota bacterium]